MTTYTVVLQLWNESKQIWSCLITDGKHTREQAIVLASSEDWSFWPIGEVRYSLHAKGEPSIILTLTDGIWS